MLKSSKSLYFLCTCVEPKMSSKMLFRYNLIYLHNNFIDIYVNDDKSIHIYSFFKSEKKSYEIKIGELYMKYFSLEHIYFNDENKDQFI